jgi:hypothetical protein
VEDFERLVIAARHMAEYVCQGEDDAVLYRQSAKRLRALEAQLPGLLADSERPTRDEFIVGADRMAAAIDDLVQRRTISARSTAADAMLDYASSRFGSENPIGELRAARSASPQETT